MKIVFEFDGLIETVLEAFKGIGRSDIRYYDDWLFIGTDTSVSMQTLAWIAVDLTTNVESIVLTEEDNDKIVEIKWSSEYGQLVEVTTTTVLFS